MSLIKISDRKREANARNAGRSTGPKTTEGKERSSRNAVSHGCTATRIHKPMRHESPDHFVQTLDGLMQSCQPVGDMETMLVKAIAASWIRIERSERWESAVLDGVMETRRRVVTKALKAEPSTEPDPDLGCCIAITDKEGSPMWDKVQRHSSKAWRDWQIALESLRKMQNARRREERLAPAAGVVTQPAAEVATAVAAPAPSAEPTTTLESTDMASFCNREQKDRKQPGVPAESQPRFSELDPVEPDSVNPARR
jgi:hypothetical protein